MKYYAVFHRPTGQYFPILHHSSSFHEFVFEIKTKKDLRTLKKPPRLFDSEWLARRYITEYCKGIKSNENFTATGHITYETPLRPRNPEDFEVHEVTLSFIKL